MITAFHVSNIIMHIILISVFIGIFFFTYGAYLERTIIKMQVEYLINDLIGSIKVFLPKSDQVKEQIKNINIDVDESEDQKVRNNNKLTKIKAFIGIFILVTIGIFIILAVSRLMNREKMTHKQFWLKLLKYNIIAIFFIGITEFVFASFYVKKYMSINTNKLKKSVIDNIITHLDDQDKTMRDKITDKITDEIKDKILI